MTFFLHPSTVTILAHTLIASIKHNGETDRSRIVSWRIRFGWSAHYFECRLIGQTHFAV
jgi:hypothetical protein